MAVQQPSAVRLYAPGHPMLAATLRSQLERRRKELLEELLNAIDWGDFSERRGKVRGIDDAIQATLDVEVALNERNR